MDMEVWLMCHFLRYWYWLGASLPDCALHHTEKPCPHTWTGHARTGLRPLKAQ